MRKALAVIVLVAFGLAWPASVSAAFNGSIDSTSGHPGDTVTVVSTDTGPIEVGATGLYFMPAVDRNRPERSINCADEPGSQFLGAFHLVGSGASLEFFVPAVDPGAYEVRMNVPSASPSCWRLWPFEVLAATPATDTSPEPTSPAWALLYLVIVFAVFSGCGLLLLWRRSSTR